ncbi:MAG: amino acid transporter [Anaerolineae bacterium]
MAESARTLQPSTGGWKRWLLQGYFKEFEGPYETETEHRQHSWWQVMCLTGVDYFSTLGYQPGIAALAAGVLSPIATLILVALTLFGALPIYSRVAAESPHGEGSIAMLERLLSWWKGKLFVLVLLGFVATDFIVTITLSAADATAHAIENPFMPAFLHGQQIALTLLLITILAAVFLKGFKEAIGLAVVLVGAYLLLNCVVVADGLYQVFHHPTAVLDWRAALFTSHGGPAAALLVSMLLFPKLALGLSGFETGVAVMPLVKGDSTDTEEKPVGRIRHTRALLFTAAAIMSVFLIASSIITTILIPPQEFQEGGAASGRALAYLAHTYLGNGFGTVYDISTILILWFAGASAMAGLLNIVPRYLPRYGMAPDWTRATRPLVLVYTVIAFAVTLLFRASVQAQGGAYATGVLVLMTSGAIAVTISAWRRSRGSRVRAAVYAVIAAIFVYTTLVNIFERPDGVKIASFFIAAIIVVSLISRIYRSTELRVRQVTLDSTARRFLEPYRGREINLVANHRQGGDVEEYRLKEQQARKDHHIPSDVPIVFLEVDVCDASEFEHVLTVSGVEVGPYKVLRAESSAVPNAIAAFLLYLRNQMSECPHVYFTWGEDNPIKSLLAFMLSGHGDVPRVTREVLRQAVADPAQRPVIHAAG